MPWSITRIVMELGSLHSETLTLTVVYSGE